MIKLKRGMIKLKGVADSPGNGSAVGAFCRVVGDADPYDGKTEAVAFAGNPRGGSPLSRFNEGFPKGGENEIFPLWRFFASFLIAQKGCHRRERERIATPVCALVRNDRIGDSADSPGNGSAVGAFCRVVRGRRPLRRQKGLACILHRFIIQ